MVEVNLSLKPNPCLDSGEVDAAGVRGEDIRLSFEALLRYFELLQ